MTLFNPYYFAEQNVNKGVIDTEESIYKGQGLTSFLWNVEKYNGENVNKNKNTLAQKIIRAPIETSGYMNSPPDELY